MRARVLMLGVAAAMVAGAAFADPIGDLMEGSGALGRHDAKEAVRLLSSALNSGGLDPADREIALARRADAFLLLGRNTEALADAEAALALQPGDAEAATVRDRASARNVPAPHGPTINTDTSLNAAIAARNAAVDAEAQAAKAAYEARLADLAAQKAASDQAYAAQMADYQATVAKANAAHAAWEAQVAACKAGDRQACARR